jgi:hypothetical protein
MAAEPRLAGPPSGAGPLRRLLARDGAAVLVASAVTVAGELGVYLAAVAAGSGRTHAVFATLAVTVVWVALAAPVLGASGADALGGLLRGGCLADASAVTLLVLYLTCPQVTLAGAAKIYCILAAMALLAVAASRLAGSPAGRYALALAAATAFAITLASPWWLGGAMRASAQETAERIVAAGVYVNPFYAVTAALSDRTRFVWHQAPVMYRITRFGDYAAAPPPVWYASVLIHCVAAALVAALAGALHRRRRRRPAPNALTNRHGPPGSASAGVRSSGRPSRGG